MNQQTRATVFSPPGVCPEGCVLAPGRLVLVLAAVGAARGTQVTFAVIGADLFLPNRQCQDRCVNTDDVSHVVNLSIDAGSENRPCIQSSGDRTILQMAIIHQVYEFL